MTSVAAIALVLLVLAATNVWVHLAPGRVHLVTGPLAAVLLLFVARTSGLTWQQLGLGRQTLLRGAQVGMAVALAVAIGYAVAVAIPSVRGAFRDTRYRLGPKAALYTALVAIPLGTVLFEEVAFRSVLWGLLARDHGALVATALSAGLFGLWHVLPALDLARTHTSMQGHLTGGRRRAVVTVLATVVFTTLAGIVFAELRRRSGSLLAPIGLHWATNGFGVLAAARVWAISPGPAPGPVGAVGAPGTSASSASPASSATVRSASHPVWQRSLRKRWSSRS